MANATVTVRGTPENPIFDFDIPQGEKGDPGGLTDGTALGSADLNTIVASGVYIQTSAIGSNYPVGSPLGTLIVHRNLAGTRIVQYFHSHNINFAGRVTFMRGYVDGVWRPWTTLASQRVDQTAGRAIYTWDDVNHREQLVWGDTGLRQITADNGYVGAVNLRRVGNLVTCTATISRPPGGSLNGIFLTAVPAGFGPDVTSWVYQPVRHNSGTGWFSFYRKNTELSFVDSTGDVDGSQVRFSSSWSTLQAWPTTLPGVASGSIPNL